MESNWRGNYARYKSFFLNILNTYKSKPDISLFIELLFSLVAISVFLVFAIKPTVITIIELNKTIKNKEETIIKLNQKITNLRKADQLLQENIELISYLLDAVPKESNVGDAIGQLQGYASLTNTNVLNIASNDIYIKGEGKAKNNNEDKLSKPFGYGGKEVQISLSLSSDDFKSIFAFIEKVERLRRPFKIDNLLLSLNTDSDTNNTTKLNLVVSGRMPYITIDTKTNTF